MASAPAFAPLILWTLLVFQSFEFGHSEAFTNVSCFDTEREALLKFRQGLIDHSKRLSSWTSKDCCEWKGVECNKKTGHVFKLDLRNPCLQTYIYGDIIVSDQCSLAGKIHASLAELKHLKYLDLSLNKFSRQEIPQFFGTLQRLEYLNLSSAGFDGNIPHHLGNLSNLQYLDLASMSYGGFLTTNNLQWVSKLSSLKYLRLSGNDLRNATDWLSSINMLSSLQSLQLKYCSLEKLPHSLSVNFTSLRFLDLSGNFINSTIPPWFYNFSKLEYLSLSRNSMSGPIPVSLGKLSFLRELDLKDNKLSGNIPESIGRLSNLEVLDMRNNLLNGVVSESHFANLTSLTSLRISSSELVLSFDPAWVPPFQLQYIEVLNVDVGPKFPLWLRTQRNISELFMYNASISDEVPNWLSDILLNVVWLDLHNNKLKGPISRMDFNKMPKLEYLSLSGNSMSGPIPVTLGELSSLRELDLSGNKLSGNIPESIGRLSNLEVLDMRNNLLNGVVSESHFANLTSLTSLRISSSELVLSFDPAWVPPFQVQSIDISGCDVGPKFPLWLQTQRNISYLRMANARISDEVPNWLSDILLNVEYIDLTNNTLKGPISRMDLNKMPLLGLLGLADNNLSGSIPNSLWAMENLYLLDLARNQLSGTIPSLSPISRMDGNKMPRLIYFYLQDNNLSGSIPNSLCAMENLAHLDLSKNQLSGTLPLCLKKLKALEMIALGDNRLRGQITNFFCHFKQLAVLNLHKNGFDEVLPQCLSNLTELVLLDLSDNDFTGEIPPFGRRFQSLAIINLENNSLTGGIPTQLCQLDSLRFLSLARNNISGSIPLCFNGLLSMVEGKDPTGSFWYNPTIIYVMVHAKRTTRLYDKTLYFFHSIDLSANNLNGEIPKELTRLVQLQNLNLSQNNLSGKIPSNIGDLKNLESLDLSNNGISGRIPPSISSLDFLSCLNLSFNNLSGPIPSSSHLRTVDNESVYRGNDGLCGAPLSKVCPRDGNDTLCGAPLSKVCPRDGNDKLCGAPLSKVCPNEGNLDIHNWFYAGLGPGFAIGFLGFCSALHFKQSWRISYFQAIDKIIKS